MKVWGGLLVLTGVIASAGIACSSGTSRKDKTATSVAAAATAAAGPKTVQVQVDGDGDGFDAYMIHYFPEKITLHAGDSVKFKLKDSGEPHTVSSGAPVKGPHGLCRELLRAGALQAPEVRGRRTAAAGCGSQVRGVCSASCRQLLPDGPGDANQAAANPCFVAAGGTVPADARCTNVRAAGLQGRRGAVQQRMAERGE